MIICCIDPGVKNFAIYVEEFDHTKLLRIKRGKRKLDIRKLNTIYKEGKCLLCEVVDLIPGIKVKCNMDLARSRLMSYFDHLRPILDRCDAFFCEKQLRLNPNAQAIEQCCYTYLTHLYLTNRVIMSVGANRKYYFTRCEKGMTKAQRKKWSPEKALEIMKMRNDDKTFLKISSSKKKDDMGDTIIIAQSLKYSVFVLNTI